MAACSSDNDNSTLHLPGRAQLTSATKDNHTCHIVVSRARAAIFPANRSSRIFGRGLNWGLCFRACPLHRGPCRSCPAFRHTQYGVVAVNAAAGLSEGVCQGRIGVDDGNAIIACRDELFFRLNVGDRQHLACHV